MALEDWRMIQPKWIAPREIMRWENIKMPNKFIGISISTFHSNKFYVNMELNQYLGGYNKESKLFKTQTAALSFAKRYMRTH